MAYFIRMSRMRQILNTKFPQCNPPDTGVVISDIDNQPDTSSISGHFNPLVNLKLSLSTCPTFVL